MTILVLIHLSYNATIDLVKASQLHPDKIKYLSAILKGIKFDIY